MSYSGQDYSNDNSLDQDISSEEEEKASYQDNEEDIDNQNDMDDQEDDDMDLQQFDQENYDLQQQIVIKDSDIYKQGNQQRISLPLLSKYEKAKILGMRAEQIDSNSPLYVKIQMDKLKSMNALQIAEVQLEHRTIPFIIRRFLPNGQFQDWKLSQLEWK